MKYKLKDLKTIKINKNNVLFWKLKSQVALAWIFELIGCLG